MPSEMDYLLRIDTDDTRPAHVQIADVLRTAINDGTLPPGAMLPSQPQLAAHFGVARETVKAALRALHHEGLINARRGKGTFVRQYSEAPPAHPHLSTVVAEFREETGESLADIHGLLSAILARLGGPPEVSGEASLADVAFPPALAARIATAARASGQSVPDFLHSAIVAATEEVLARIVPER